MIFLLLCEKEGASPKVAQKSPKAETSNWGVQFGGIPIKEESSRGIGKSMLRQVGRVGRAGVTGIAGLADIPNLAAMGLHAAGLKEEPTFYKPVASRVQEGIDTLTGGELKPEGKAEEYMDIIGEGLAPLALAPFTGGASLTGTVAKGLGKAATGLPGRALQKISKFGSKPYALTGSNIAGSAGSSAAVKAYLDEGGDPNLIGPLLASMAGGAAARGALRLKNPLNAAAEGIGRATQFSPEKYAKNAELGLPVTPANVSKSNLPRYVEMVAAKMPGSMGPLEDFYKNREAAIAGNLGIRTPGELEQAVRNVPKHLAKEGAEGYHKRASDIYKARESKFLPREKQAIANKEVIDVSDIINKLEHEKSLSLTEAAKNRFDKTKGGILLKELRESVPETSQSPLIKDLKKQGYTDDLIKKIIKTVEGESPITKKGIGLHDLNELRKKALQESLELKTPLGAGTPESRGASERARMLGEKRHQFIEEIGTPSEKYNASQARRFWAQYKDDKNGMSKYVAKITGTPNDASAFKKLISDDPKFLNVARQGLKHQDRTKLAEAIVADLGERQGRFNINSVHTAFSNLENPVKQEFLKTLPNQAAKNNFTKTMRFIGDNKKMMESLANTSNTAHSNHIIDLMKRYGTATAAAATGYGIMDLTGLVATYAGLKYGAKIWTNQNFLKRMNDVMTNKNIKGETNKLDLLMKSVNQLGRQSKHMDQGYAKGGAVKHRQGFPGGGLTGRAGFEAMYGDRSDDEEEHKSQSARPPRGYVPPPMVAPPQRPASVAPVVPPPPPLPVPPPPLPVALPPVPLPMLPPVLGGLKLMAPKLREDHVRYLSHKDLPANPLKVPKYLREQASEKAQRRMGQANNPIDASTIISMNNGLLKDWTNFVRDPATQAALGKNQLVNFNVVNRPAPHARIGRALTNEQLSSKYYSDPGFTMQVGVYGPQPNYTYPPGHQYAGQTLWIPGHLNSVSPLPGHQPINIPSINKKRKIKNEPSSGNIQDFDFSNYTPPPSRINPHNQ